MRRCGSTFSSPNSTRWPNLSLPQRLSKHAGAGDLSNTRSSSSLSISLSIIPKLKFLSISHPLQARFQPDFASSPPLSRLEDHRQLFGSTKTIRESNNLRYVCFCALFYSTLFFFVILRPLRDAFLLLLSAAMDIIGEGRRVAPIRD